MLSEITSSRQMISEELVVMVNFPPWNVAENCSDIGQYHTADLEVQATLEIRVDLENSRWLKKQTDFEI